MENWQYFLGLPFGIALIFIPRALAMFLIVWVLSWSWPAYLLCLLGLFLDYHAHQAISAGVEMKVKTEKPRQ